MRQAQGKFAHGSDFALGELNAFVQYMQEAQRQNVPKVGPVRIDLGMRAFEDDLLRNCFLPYVDLLDQLYLKGRFYEDTVRLFMRRFLEVNAAIKVSFDVSSKDPVYVNRCLSTIPYEARRSLEREFDGHLKF